MVIVTHESYDSVLVGTGKQKGLESLFENREWRGRCDVERQVVPDGGTRNRKRPLANYRETNGQICPLSATALSRLPLHESGTLCRWMFVHPALCQRSSVGSRPSSSHEASLTDATAWIFVTFVRWPRSFGLCHHNLICSVIVSIIIKRDFDCLTSQPDRRKFVVMIQLMPRVLCACDVKPLRRGRPG